MLERELTLYKFNLKFLRTLVADIDDADLGKSPFPGANPPVWILGHLAVATDSAARVLGLPRECPREWHVQFSPGTLPSNVKSPYPTKAELMEAIEKGHRRVSEAAANAPQELLDTPHTIEILKASVLKTLGDVLAHLMSNHESFHLAQLSACRRHKGIGPVI